MAATSKFRASQMCIRHLATMLAACVLLTISFLTANAQATQSAAKPAHTTAESSAQFQSLSRRAMEALDADKLQDAVPLLRKALSLKPSWAEGWWSLGTAYYDQQSYAEAELAFQRVVALDPKHGTARAFLGLCEFELGDDKAALRDIESTKELGTNVDPQLREVLLFHEGVLLQRAGRFIAAEKPFVSLCLNNGGGSEVARAFGMAVLRMRDRQPPSPGSESAAVVQQVGHAACLAAQKDFDSSRRQFTLVIDAHSHFPYVHYAFGRVLFDARDIPGAVDEFKRELDEGHDRLLPILQIAASEYKVDSVAGLPYAEQAVALAPHLPFAHYLLGLLLVDTGADQKAIPELEAAHRAFPQDTKVYWALAAAYAHVGRVQDAAKARAEVGRISRNSPPPDEGGGAPPDAPINVTDTADQGPNN